MNEEAVLEPGETLEAEGRVFLDSAGTWLVWPCYELAGGEACPDEWQVITFLVESLGGPPAHHPRPSTAA